MEARIDKWLWGARIFKTRTIAADACKNGRVAVNGISVKPSRMVKVDDVINVRKPPITYSFRILKASGSNGGHNGLGHIQQLIGQQYARLRMGIGSDYPMGGQIDWVLGRFSDEELKQLTPRLELAAEIVKSFVLAGIDITMNQYNKLGKWKPE